MTSAYFIARHFLVLAQLALLPLAFTACFSPAYKNGGLQCTNQLCPEGYQCALPSNTCWRLGTAPDSDAGTGGESGDPSPGNDAGDVPSPPVDSRDGDLAPPDPDVGPEDDALGDPIAQLQSLEVVPGTLDPPFESTTFRYDLNLPLFTPNIGVTALAEVTGATVSLNDGSISTTQLVALLKLSPGQARANVRVAAPGFRSSLYGVSINTGGVFTYLKGASTQVNMAFGTSAALSGNTLVIGAPNERGTATGPQTTDPSVPGMESGAAFVFRREAGRWRYEVTLKPGHLHPMMTFGESVAVVGDTVVVGAPGENGSSTMINGPRDTRAAGAGAAFVFVRGSEGTWTQQAYLKASDAAAGDRFGTSVAVSTVTTSMGNVTTTAAVGAPGADGASNGARAGAAYVFMRPAGSNTWGEQARPRPNNLRAGHEFGTSLSLAGDTLVVGSPGEDSGAGGVNPGATMAMSADSGAAYVFVRTGSLWPQPVYIKAPTALAQARFGTRAVVQGNFLAVGAPGDSGGGGGVSPSGGGPAVAGSGAAFLYRRAGTTWELVHHIKAPVPRPQDRFGKSLALSGANPTLVVGAPFDDTNEAGAYDPQMTSTTLDSGAIFAYRPDADGRWSQVARLKAPNAERLDAFGTSVAVEGDTVVAGADGEASSAIHVDGTLANNEAPGSGAAYVF